MQADVFAKKPLEGNPCAVVFDADDLLDSEMLAVARETNQSETVFIKHSKDCDFRPRYYTRCEEIPLAGHPTIATIHCLIQAGLIDISQLPKSISLELTAGKIRVDIEPADDGFRIVMFQLKPVFMRTYSAAEILPLFKLDPHEVLPGAPIQTVSTGTPMLMVPLKSLDALKRAELDIGPYSAFRTNSDFFSPHLFCLQGVDEDGDTFARHFFSPPNTTEDPFTGSASGCMISYLWHYGLIDKPRITAQQGHWMHRPGQAQLEVNGEPHDIQAVKLFGNAITILDATLFLSV
jgi:trans-2,3-dihydro-3-hydroxyanthranilate isomerase